jgi:hypothetical protein
LRYEPEDPTAIAGLARKIPALDLGEIAGATYRREPTAGD